MSTSRNLVLTAIAFTMATLAASEPLFARGGAANIMNSPGYQRRLQESRQQIAQPSAPSTPTHHRKRHRARH